MAVARSQKKEPPKRRSVTLYFDEVFVVKNHRVEVARQGVILAVPRFKGCDCAGGGVDKNEQPPFCEDEAKHEPIAEPTERPSALHRSTKA